MSCSLDNREGLTDGGKEGDEEADERLFAVAAWREAPYFTEAERAALALTEAATRLSDRPDPVPDEVWEEAARHYDEPTLAALIIEIALINFWKPHHHRRQAGGGLETRLSGTVRPDW